MAQLTIGAWQQAPVNPLRLVNLRINWGADKIDGEGFLRNGPAVTIHGTNRYSGQPVDTSGLTYEAWALSQAIVAAFPDSPTKRNYAVDRNRRGSAALSDHALGEACDIISQKHDGRLGVSASDRAWGQRVFDFVVDSMCGSSGVGLRGRAWSGPFRVYYALYDGQVCRASEGSKVRPIRSGDPHRDHIHVSIVPVDRRPGAVPAPPPKPEPRRTLRLRRPRMTGEDVELVQGVVGATVDGVFGPQTFGRVRVWQRAQGLIVDGVVGPQTWAAIDRELAP